MIGDNTKLYSWVDIQDQLIKAQSEDNWPENVFVEVRQSGLYIYHKEDVTFAEIKTWLDTQLPNAVHFDNGHEEGNIELELMGKTPKPLPVFLETLEANDRVISSLSPSFTRPAILQKLPATRQEEYIKPAQARFPQIIAAHSFKGGVGRTLHALALAEVLSSIADQKVLLIDGDFEAPGITWMSTNPEIAFVDLINLVHSSTEPFEVIPSIASDLRNQQKGNIFFMPAFRTVSQLRSLEIKPEHIFQFADNKFILTEVLSKLGEALGVTHVIIDLRAGISELSSNWLLDPSVIKVFVTTLSSQSVEGTLIIINLLLEYQKRLGAEESDIPSLIISQIDEDQIENVRLVWEGDLDAGANTGLQNVVRLREGFDRFSTDEEESVSLVLSQLYDSLLILPNDWNKVRNLMKQSGLLDNLSELTLLFENIPIEDSASFNGLEERRARMQQQFSRLIVAEEELPDNFYKSPAIRNLAEKHKTRLPNLIILGSKGSGKTFLYRQLARIGDWASFLQKVDANVSTSINAPIYRVTVPEYVQDEDKPQVWVREIKPALQNALAEEKTILEWRDFWLDLMAWSTNYQIGQSGVGKSFISEMEKQSPKAIFIFDGLEDLFQEYFTSDRQKTALKALVQDVQSYIGATPNSPIGLIVFIRRDIIQHVITQNFNQLSAKYSDYELRWNEVEALRLVAWLMKQYNILDIETISDDDLMSASKEGLTRALFPLWGRKLGKDTSREARSAKKILETLSNFNQELQSRDLIRFLAEAAKQEIDLASTTPYSDRLLSPSAIKKAFPSVGREKIREIKEENRANEFFQIISKLETDVSQLKIPFTDTEDLNQSEINELIRQGVLRFHSGKYYMTELFREGLGIEKSSRGKSKTNF